MGDARPRSYAEKRSAKAAREISLRHGIGFDAALRITEGVWGEAQKIVRKLVGAGQWHCLSFSDKSVVCQLVVKALLDKERLASSLSQKGNRIN